MPFAPILIATERILLTLWIGGMWTVGLVVAPTLFKNYARVLAGDIAGRLFSILSSIGIVCAVLLLASCAMRARGAVWRDWRDWRAGLVLLMLVIILIGEFGVAARMRELKELLAASPAASASLLEFQWLHRSASLLFLTNSALGLELVIFGVRPPVQPGS